MAFVVRMKANTLFDVGQTLYRNLLLCSVVCRLRCRLRCRLHCRLRCRLRCRLHYRLQHLLRKASNHAWLWKLVTNVHTKLFFLFFKSSPNCYPLFITEDHNNTRQEINKTIYAELPDPDNQSSHCTPAGVSQGSSCYTVPWGNTKHNSPSILLLLYTRLKGL